MILISGHFKTPSNRFSTLKNLILEILIIQIGHLVQKILTYWFFSMVSGGHFLNRFPELLPWSNMSTQVFFTQWVVPWTNFNRNLGDLKMHTGPPSARGILGDVLWLHVDIHEAVLVKNGGVSGGPGECIYLLLPIISLHRYHIIDIFPWRSEDF